MSTKQINLELQPSTSYLVISLLIYALCLILQWWRLESIWLNIALTVAIGFSAMTFFGRYVLLSKSNAITSITLEDDHASFSAKNGETPAHGNYSISYQSRVLVIIRLGKIYVPVFKDNLTEGNLSSLNRFINVG